MCAVCEQPHRSRGRSIVLIECKLISNKNRREHSDGHAAHVQRTHDAEHCAPRYAQLVRQLWVPEYEQELVTQSHPMGAALVWVCMPNEGAIVSKLSIHALHAPVWPTTLCSFPALQTYHYVCVCAAPTTFSHCTQALLENRGRGGVRRGHLLSYGWRWRPLHGDPDLVRCFCTVRSLHKLLRNALSFQASTQCAASDSPQQHHEAAVRKRENVVSALRHVFLKLVRTRNLR